MTTIKKSSGELMHSSTASRMDIKAAYWCLLGRLPEDDQAIENKSTLTLDGLTRELIASEEFLGRTNNLQSSYRPYSHAFSLDDSSMNDLTGSNYVRYLGDAPGTIQSSPDSQLLKTLETKRLKEIYAEAGVTELRARICSHLYDQAQAELRFKDETRHLQRTSEPADVTIAYLIFLGRAPESDIAISAKVGLVLVDLISSLLASAEFYDAICIPLFNHELVLGHRFWHLTDDKVVAWCTKHGLISLVPADHTLNVRMIFSSIMESSALKVIHSRYELHWSLDKLLHCLGTADDGLATHQFLEGRITHVFGRSHLQLMLNRVTDLSEIRVDTNAPRRVNVLVPAFDFKSMSAGFFGVFQVAKFVKSCGYRVRLIMFDNFYWNETEFRQKLLGYPGMEDLFDELEVEYVGDRTSPITVSPHDRSVATVWYSAYLADKISSYTGNSPFLYLIQDYETNFYSGGSHFSLADATYSMNYGALFSSSSLQDFFVDNKIGSFGQKASPSSTYFNNASASHLPEIKSFLDRRGPSRLAFYSRSVVHRNMFELGALALIEAYKNGIFTGREWEFLGVGLGDASIQLSSSKKLIPLERMNLRDYSKSISTFDVGLCLMASPHPSLLPFDLGGSGATVVTNTFMNKDQRYFDKLCTNVIARPPTLSGLVEGLAEAVQRTPDREERHRRAAESSYPTSWEKTFSPSHVNFVRDLFR